MSTLAASLKRESLMQALVLAGLAVIVLYPRLRPIRA